MEVNDFINNLITDKAPYRLTTEDEKTIQFEGIEQYIYRKLNNSKYKATKTTEDYEKIVKEKINYSVKNNLPIHLDLSTGATKNPNAVWAPGIDWAEVFNVAFVREYLKPIAAAYENGIVLDYFSVAVFEEKVNFIPKADVELYDKQFTELVKIYQDYLPEKLKIRYSRLSDRGSQDDIYAAVDKKIVELREIWPTLAEEVRNDKLKRAERNIYFTGNETNREEMILNSVLGHDAFSGDCWSDFAAPIWNEPDDISLGHRFTAGWAIHIRSAPGSTVNYWSGTGVLVKREEKFIPTVLSPKQYKELSDKITEVKCEFFNANEVLSSKLKTVLVAQ